MHESSVDFDVVSDRADHCGTTWALRTISRLRKEETRPPETWPGSIQEARRLVATFVSGVGVLDREKLAQLIERAAQVEYESWIAPVRDEPRRMVVSTMRLRSQPFARLSRVA